MTEIKTIDWELISGLGLTPRRMWTPRKIQEHIPKPVSPAKWARIRSVGPCDRLFVVLRRDFVSETTAVLFACVCAERSPKRDGTTNRNLLNRRVTESARLFVQTRSPENKKRLLSVLQKARCTLPYAEGAVQDARQAMLSQEDSAEKTKAWKVALKTEQLLLSATWAAVAAVLTAQTVAGYEKVTVWDAARNAATYGHEASCIVSCSPGDNREWNEWAWQCNRLAQLIEGAA